MLALIRFYDDVVRLFKDCHWVSFGDKNRIERLRVSIVECRLFLIRLYKYEKRTFLPCRANSALGTKRSFTCRLSEFSDTSRTIKAGHFYLAKRGVISALN